MEDISQYERECFEAGAEYLEEISKEEFRDRFGTIFDCLEDFDRETDAFLFEFSLTVDSGIDDWRLQHLDLSTEGDIWDAQKTGHSLEESDPGNELGINMIAVETIRDETPNADEFQDALKTAFERTVQYGDPVQISMNPSLGLRIASTEDGFDISAGPIGSDV